MSPFFRKLSILHNRILTVLNATQIVDFEAKTVCYYDSMGSPNASVCFEMFIGLNRSSAHHSLGVFVAMSFVCGYNIVRDV